MSIVSRKPTKKISPISDDGDKAAQNAIAKSLSFVGPPADIVENTRTIWILMSTFKNILKRLWANSWSSLASQMWEFWIGQLKPANVDNLQAEISYVEQIAKIIAKSPSVTAQNSYISKVVDLLPDFDFSKLSKQLTTSA